MKNSFEVRTQNFLKSNPLGAVLVLKKQGSVHDLAFLDSAAFATFKNENCPAFRFATSEEQTQVTIWTRGLISDPDGNFQGIDPYDGLTFTRESSSI